MTKKFIGLGSLIRNEEKSVEAEIGYIKRLVAIINPKNIPSRKILISEGFMSEKICEISGLPGKILSKDL